MSDVKSLTEVLTACVAAAGGAKVVGAKLWPEKLVDHAQRTLLDCLNDERPHRLTPEQVLLIMRLGYQAGHHGPMEYLATSLGYTAPVPVSSQDRKAELQRAFVQAVSLQQQLVAQMQALLDGAQPGLKAVA